MAEMKKFETDFVKRTKDILNNNVDIEEYEVTFLLNCLLGMVTLPVEIEKDKKSEKSMKFQNDCIKKLKELSQELIWKENNDNQLFRNIRNAIAHLNISFKLNSYKNIEYVVLKNKKNGRTGKCTFQVTISVNNLKKFAEYVAQEYLDRKLYE